MNKAKEEITERLAEKFVILDPDMKDKIAWYMLGRQEEREKQEREKQTA